ncbi:MAG: hypothetical protein HY748_07895 [Elusimicrobia bacterium]|nr:hypothetical protein [Elusimicrobiota bacterium]
MTAQEARRPVFPVLVIIAAVALSFGVHAPSLGFYHDDWVFIELASRAGGFWGAVKAFASAGYLSRPVEILQFPSFFAVGGTDPLPYHLLMLSLEAAQGVLFFLLLDRLLGSRRLALTAAVLAAAHPSRSALHVWFASSPQTLALALALASLLVFERRAELRSAAAVLASQVLYLASVLCYESTAFLPLMLAGAHAGRAWAKGPRALGPGARSLAALWPYAASLALALLYQRFAASVLQESNPKTVGLSLAHAVKVFGAGLECLTNRVLHLVWTSIPGFWSESSAAAIIAWVAIAGSSVLLLAVKDDLKSPAVRGAAGAAVMGFIGAYLPYALSASYVPQVFGFMSRTNGAGALAGGLLLALAAASLGSRPAVQGSFLGLLVLAFTLVHWQTGRQFARLRTAQEGLLASVAGAAAGLPHGAVVLLDLVPRDGPALFAGHFDFSAALRLKTGRPDLGGDIVKRNLAGRPGKPSETAAGGAVEAGGRASRTPSGKALAAGGAFVYSEKTATLTPLGGPP